LEVYGVTISTKSTQIFSFIIIVGCWNQFSVAKPTDQLTAGWPIKINRAKSEIFNET
jgi:hypothetical protein